MQTVTTTNIDQKLAEVVYKNISNTEKLQHIFPDAVVTVENGFSGKVVKVNGQTAYRVDARHINKLTAMISAYNRAKA